MKPTISNRATDARSAPMPSAASLTSRLGFKTALIRDAGSPAEIDDLLEKIFEAGITHFDTAPMYGSGTTDALMAPFVGRHRNHIRLASKVGILPEGRDPVSKIVRKAGWVDTLHRRHSLSWLWPSANPVFHAFSPAQMDTALTSTMRNLNTDYLDILLLHDMTIADDRDEVWTYLDKRKASGAFGQLGLATHASSSVALFSRHRDRLEIVQIPHGELGSDATRADFTGAQLITHDPFTRDFRALSKIMQSSGKVRTLLMDPALADVPEPLVLPVLSVYRALIAHSDTSVLCTDPSASLAHYLGLLDERAPSDATMNLLELLLEQV